MKRKWTSLLLGLVALALAIWIVVYLFRASRRQFWQETGETLLQSVGDGDGVCSSHCFKDSTGLISDQYDCCECKAQTGSTDGPPVSQKDGGPEAYEPNFQKCMCQAGYGDFCFKPVTNFLLSL